MKWRETLRNSLPHILNGCQFHIGEQGVSVQTVRGCPNLGSVIRRQRKNAIPRRMLRHMSVEIQVNFHRRLRATVQLEGAGQWERCSGGGGYGGGGRRSQPHLWLRAWSRTCGWYRQFLPRLRVHRLNGTSRVDETGRETPAREMPRPQPRRTDLQGRTESSIQHSVAPKLSHTSRLGRVTRRIVTKKNCFRQEKCLADVSFVRSAH